MSSEDIYFIIFAGVLGLCALGALIIYIAAVLIMWLPPLSDEARKESTKDEPIV